MNQPSREEIAQALDDAADLILIHGWKSGPPEKGDPTLCVQAAIAKATGGTYWGLPDLCPIGKAAHDALVANGAYRLFGDEIHRDNLGTVYIWNDEPGRTEDEVFDLLRNTSKALREEAGAA